MNGRYAYAGPRLSPSLFVLDSCSAITTASDRSFFDELKHGIWANEKAIQNNTEMIQELYKRYREEHK